MVSDARNLIAQQWADRFAAAYDTVAGGPGPAQPTGQQQSLPDGLATLDVQAAYQVQRLTIEQLLGEYGGHVAGYKVSLAAAADQAAFGVDEPTYGTLTDAHLRASGDSVALADCINPLVEPEVLLRTTSELSGEVSLEQIAASAELGVGFELPIARFRRPPPPSGPVPTVAGLIADNSLGGYLFVGDRWSPALDPAELAQVTVETVYPDGETRTGRADRVLDSPYGSARWLVRALARHGRSLPAGSIVSAGTLMPAFPAVPGEYVARFGHDLGDVRFTAR